MRRKIVITLIIALLLSSLTLVYGNTGSPIKWEDDFLDESRIDIEKSYNYTINRTAGFVAMKNTYKCWRSSEWTRMREITVENNGDETLYDYVMDLTIPYDEDMKNDFSDLRFRDYDGNDLPYWIGERIPGEEASAVVRIPEVPPGETKIYMFYGNPNAEDNSNFDLIFTWDDRTDPDMMISYKNYLEGAWDPDVEYGNGRFLVAWEERVGPEDQPRNMERILSSQIHGRTYNVDGEGPYPTGNIDIYISTVDSNDTTRHSENPSIAFGENKFLVVWEENPSGDIALRFEADIKAAFVTPNGEVTERFIVCDAPSLQCDPCVAYDRCSHRFLVVWEDARRGTENYDIYGRILDESGNPVTDEFPITIEPNCQDQPWVCSDNQGYFLVVYEDGYHPSNGPFSLRAQRIDSSGNKVGSTITIVEGTEDRDNIFPTVSFSPATNKYCITWNDADLSEGRWRGNIWGKIIDRYGNVIEDCFIIQPGVEYIMSNVVPYLNTMFFVSYDDGNNIWGTLVSSDGRIQTKPHMLSDGSSLNADWSSLATGEGRIFAVWEDERDEASEYADTFGSVWHIYRSTGSPYVSYSIGLEKKLVTKTVVMSKIIEPGEGFIEWYEFNATYYTPTGSIRFDIMDEDGIHVILGGVDPGEDISFLPEQPIRLRATLTRITPVDTPILDKWSITWIGNDLEPPWTLCEMNPPEPDGENGWYTVPVEFTLEAHDDVSPPEEITTYYCIDEGPQQIYEPYNKPRITEDGGNHSIEYWSIDASGNEEKPHNMISGIKIDKTKPRVTIHSPEWGKVSPGEVTVKATVDEETSGVDRVEIWFNGGKAAVFEGEKPVYTWVFTAERGQQYDIEVRAYDNAGLMGNDFVSVKCPRSKMMDILWRITLRIPLFRILLTELIFYTG